MERRRPRPLLAAAWSRRFCGSGALVIAGMITKGSVDVVVALHFNEILHVGVGVGVGHGCFLLCCCLVFKITVLSNAALVVQTVH